jgi:hypothetical protein
MVLFAGGAYERAMLNFRRATLQNLPQVGPAQDQDQSNMDSVRHDRGPCIV